MVAAPSAGVKRAGNMRRRAEGGIAKTPFAGAIIVRFVPFIDIPQGKMLYLAHDHTTDRGERRIRPTPAQRMAGRTVRVLEYGGEEHGRWQAIVARIGPRI